MVKTKKPKTSVNDGSDVQFRSRWNNVVESRDEQHTLKKNAVIAEASRAFARRGYKNVSLDEIATALHVTKTALYYYFKNKQSLIYECHELAMSIGRRALDSAIERESTGFSRVSLFVRSYIELLTTELGAPIILYDIDAMTPSDQKKILKLRREFDHQLRLLIEQGLADGTIHSCEPKMAVFWFMGAINAIPQWFHADGSLSGHDVADAFVAFLARGFERSEPLKLRKIRA